ncbi:hypothetical protein C2845_PM11G00530 [Panicum miliaceum]|uniref:Uncharacterized protein n=1 Tax=Panicum miliaceum TaxID=4540 RepID=A0A3L6RW11_PANMI|nr:hypothetical protein C2845_PM11G00530 [Panicum miliaceum]
MKGCCVCHSNEKDDIFIHLGFMPTSRSGSEILLKSERKPGGRGAAERVGWGASRLKGPGLCGGTWRAGPDPLGRGTAGREVAGRGVAKPAVSQSCAGGGQRPERSCYCRRGVGSRPQRATRRQAPEQVLAMSSQSEIMVYYGVGDIVNGPSSVDLSSFPYIIVTHPDPNCANIRYLRDWFAAMFQLDQNLYSVTVQCLFLRGINPVINELRFSDQTYRWRKWVEWCRRCNAPLTILVQSCSKEVVGEARSSQQDENESGLCGHVPFDQLEIREEGCSQREELDVDGVAEGGERVVGIVEVLEANDRNAIE